MKPVTQQSKPYTPTHTPSQTCRYARSHTDMQLKIVNNCYSPEQKKTKNEKVISSFYKRLTHKTEFHQNVHNISK